jgi:flavodoxin
MNPTSDPARRDLLGAMVAAVAASASSPVPGEAAVLAPASGATVMVAYLSRTGNTRVVANQIRRALGADIFEIETAAPYPEDYEATVAQAERERVSGFEPPLKAAVPRINTYRAVFLGFPIWGTTAPSVIRSFLSKHDFAGTTLIPFITHGGYGPGDSMAVVARHAPGVRLRSPFVMRAPQERQTLAQVSRFLAGVTLAHETIGRSTAKP